MHKKKPWYEIHKEAGVDMETDPQKDAKASQEKSRSHQDQPGKGITTVGGGDHGKVNKGVKIVSARK